MNKYLKIPSKEDIDRTEFSKSYDKFVYLVNYIKNRRLKCKKM